ncbi:MAG: antibiotic biosynthesis monooxygenase [Nocardioidaceae bacterium]|nr:antibiotic biosynthesis monooxygenase [Nocardioidaceae bacterium]
MTVRLAVLITTNPGMGSQQIEAFAELVPIVRAEQGCIQYDLHQVVGEPDQFVVLELWESHEDLAAHASSPHMAAAAATAGAYRSAPAQILELSHDPLV